LRGGERGLLPRDRAPQVARVDLQEELPLGDAVALVDREVGDAAHRVGADVDVALRLDLARRRDERLEASLLDRFGGDLDALDALELDVRERNRAERGEDRQADEDLLVPAHYEAPPNDVFTTAMVMAIT